jgi:hypothetical protein
VVAEPAARGIEFAVVTAVSIVLSEIVAEEI